MKAWLFQDPRQKKKLGDKCPWSVGWIDPEGKRCSRRIGSKSLAEKFQRRTEGQLAAGTYEHQSRKPWDMFRKEYEAKILPRLAGDTQRVVQGCLDHFERLIKPARIAVIGTKVIDQYIAKRRLEPGKKPGSTLSPASLNKELRHLKAVLRIAHEWGYLTKLPKFRKERESELIGPVVTPEHFEAMYEACQTATLPAGLPCAAADWWRALLVFAISTGWRIEEILSLRRSDLDLETGAIKTRAADNKGRRDDMDYLPAVALDHLRLIPGFQSTVFFWPHVERYLYDEFHRIQTAAGIHLVCPRADEHECTPSCHWYGFHALRRAYGTLNADRMPAAVLQRKMRHRSFTTTLRYISLADKMKKTSEQVFVPEFLKKKR